MNDIRTKPPCYGCERHAEGCHATCEAYLGWAEARRQAREARWNSARGQRDVDNRHMDQCIRQRKRRER